MVIVKTEGEERDVVVCWVEEHFRSLEKERARERNPEVRTTGRTAGVVFAPW
jgi:hypothetical protein